MAARPVKWHWALYGLTVGMTIVVAALILDGSDYQVAWLQPIRGTGVSATVLIAGTIGLVAGIIRDRMLQ